MRVTSPAVVSVSALMLTIAGCGGGWKTYETDTPWAAPGQRVTEKHRQSPVQIMGAPEIIWIDAEGTTHKPAQILAHVEAYADAIGLSAKVKANLQDSSLPWFTLVSINPTVVIMATSDPARAKHGELLAPYNAVGEFSFGGGLECGSKLFYSEGMQWFSPDLQQDLKEIVFANDGTAEIPLPDGKLVLRRDGELCRITRK